MQAIRLIFSWNEKGFFLGCAPVFLLGCTPELNFPDTCNPISATALSLTRNTNFRETSLPSSVLRLTLIWICECSSSSTLRCFEKSSSGCLNRLRGISRGSWAEAGPVTVNLKNQITSVGWFDEPNHLHQPPTTAQGSSWYFQNCR